MVEHAGDSESDEDLPEKSTRGKSATSNRYDFSILKFLRKQRGMTLQDLSRQSGVSYAPLANLENNKIKPNLETLDKICVALDIPTYNLLALAERKFVEHLQWKRLPHDNAQVQYYDFGQYTLLIGRLNGGHRLSNDGAQRIYFETVYVLQGKVALDLQGRVYPLTAGGSLCFDSIFEHCYSAVEDSIVVIIRQKK